MSFKPKNTWRKPIPQNKRGKKKKKSLYGGLVLRLCRGRSLSSTGQARKKIGQGDSYFDKKISKEFVTKNSQPNGTMSNLPQIESKTYCSIAEEKKPTKEGNSKSGWIQMRS